MLAAATRDDVLAQLCVTSAKSPFEAERRLRAYRGHVPGPLTQPSVGTLAGAQPSSHPRPLSPLLWVREETHGLRSSQSRGYASNFSSNGTAVRGECASEGCPCSVERAGRVPDLVRHEAASPFHRDSLLTPDSTRFRTSSRVAAASKLATSIQRRARRKASETLYGRRSLAPLPEVRPLLLGNGECPHLT